MAGTFSLAFRGTFDQLLTKINVNDALLFKLHDYSVLTYSQVRECKAQSSPEERVFTLLELLEKRDDSLFEDFLRALNETNQSHVVEFLKKENKKARWATTSTKSWASAEVPRQRHVIRLHDHFSVTAAKSLTING
jgi:hypothetical protein